MQLAFENLRKKQEKLINEINKLNKNTSAKAQEIKKEREDRLAELEKHLAVWYDPKNTYNSSTAGSQILKFRGSNVKGDNIRVVNNEALREALA